MRIHVTQEDIYTGYPCSSAECPVAVAINRQIPVKYFSLVDGNYIYIRKRDFSKEHTVVTPRSVARFIRKVDNDKKAKPFRFNLNWEEE